MSFILDALRKSEHERQRQTGPALAEVAVAPPKPRSNVWATAAIALLLVNLVAVGVLLIRKASREPAGQPAVAGPQAPVPAAPSAAPPAQVTMTQTAPATSAVPNPPPMLQPAREAEPAEAASNRNPLEAEVSASAPSLDPQMAAQAAAVPPGPPAVTRAPSGKGKVIYESLPDSSSVGSPQYEAEPRSNTAPSAGPKLPTADEVSAAGGVPALKLELHVYSNKPADRMVFINAHKYREGDTMVEGPVVRQITPDGAILEYRGRQFVLTRD